MRPCFVDMDGVLADFNGGILKRHNRPDPYLEPANWGQFDMEVIWGITAREFWAPVNEDPTFWDELKPMPDGQAIMNSVLSVYKPEDVAILTAPSSDPQCIPGKRRWIERYFPEFKKRIIFTAAKEFLARPGAVLVDDKDSNCDHFTAAGGSAILVPRPWNREHDYSFLASSQVSYELARLRPSEEPCEL